MSSGVTNPAYAVNERVLRDFSDVDFKVATTDEESVSPFEAVAVRLHQNVGAHPAWVKSRGGYRKPMRAHVVTVDAFGQSKNSAVKVRISDADFAGTIGAYLVGLVEGRFFKAESFLETLYPVHNYSASSRGNELERIIADLGRLRDGWAGAGSQAPKATVIRDVERIFSAFDNDTAVPNIEVDGEDGSAVMYWQVGREAFSLMVGGDGRISGVLSPSRQDYKIWTISSSETEKLARRLEDPAIAHLIKG